MQDSKSYLTCVLITQLRKCNSEITENYKILFAFELWTSVSGSLAHMNINERM